MIHKNKELTHAAMWSVLNQFVSQILVLVVFLVTARFVSKEDFGVMAASMLFVEVCRQIIIESVANGLLAKKDPSAEFYNAAFFFVLSVAIALALLIIAFSPAIGNLLNQEKVGKALQLIAPILVLSSLGRIQEVWLSKHLKFRDLAIRAIASVVVGGFVGIVMAIYGMGVLSLVAQQLITASMSAIWLWLTCEWRPNRNCTRADLKQVFSMSYPLSTNHGIAVIGGQADVFFASMYLGAAATGVFNAAKRIHTAAHMILCSSLNSVAMPSLSLLGKESAELAGRFVRFTCVTSVVTAPIFFGIAAISPDLVLLILGEKWSDVSPVLSILAIGGYITAIGQYANHIMLIFDRPSWVIWSSLAGAIVTVVLLMIFSSYGIKVLATVLVVKSFVFLPINVHLALKLMGVRWKTMLKGIAPSLGAAVLMALGVALLRNFFGSTYLTTPLALMLVGVIFYTGLVFIFDRKGMLSIYLEFRAALTKHAVST